MRRVIVESPYAGDVELHTRYLRRCLADCIARGEAPIASHGLLPGVLDDTIPAQRDAGIRAGLAWYPAARACVVYVDFGISKGMERGIAEAKRFGVLVEERTIGCEEATLEVEMIKGCKTCEEALAALCAELEVPCCEGCFARLTFATVSEDDESPQAPYAEQWTDEDGLQSWQYACGVCETESAGDGELPSVADLLRRVERLPGRKQLSSRQQSSAVKSA